MPLPRKKLPTLTEEPDLYEAPQVDEYDSEYEFEPIEDDSTISEIKDDDEGYEKSEYELEFEKISDDEDEEDDYEEEEEDEYEPPKKKKFKKKPSKKKGPRKLDLDDTQSQDKIKRIFSIIIIVVIILTIIILALKLLSKSKDSKPQDNKTSIEQSRDNSEKSSKKENSSSEGISKLRISRDKVATITLDRDTSGQLISIYEEGGKYFVCESEDNDFVANESKEVEISCARIPGDKAKNIDNYFVTSDYKILTE